jgi:hypothetical protein
VEGPIRRDHDTIKIDGFDRKIAAVENHFSHSSTFFGVAFMRGKIFYFSPFVNVEPSS